MRITGQPEYGYWYTPSESEDAPGGCCLDIVIFETPTGQHFDPHYVTVTAKTENGLETVRFHHPWEFHQAYQLCAGMVEMVDRRGEKEKAFTFGGQVSLKVQPDWTQLTLESTAPIFEISEVNSLKWLWVDEVEILLAEGRAAFTGSRYEFEQRLADADPSALYAACLEALIQRFETLALSSRELQITRLLHALQAEKRRLIESGQMAKLPPVLEKILGQGNL